MNKIIIAIISVLVGALVFVASLPIFDSLTMTTTATDNEGMYDLRYDLVDSHSMFTVVVDYDELNDILTLTNGSDVQTFTGENLEYFYADDNVSVLSADGFIFMVGKNTDNEVYYVSLDEVPITITRTNAGVSIECNGVTYTYGAPTYAYVPLKTGKYATFSDGQGIVTNSSLKDAFFGYYAGVYTYNGMNTEGLELYLNKSYDENDNLDGAIWLATEPEEITPDNLEIQPFDPGYIQLNPIVIEPVNPDFIEPQIFDPGYTIMSVPTPTYNDGDWGFDVSDGKATIVSYSGTGGNIIVPNTVSYGGNTYNVTKFGKGSDVSDSVFDNSSIQPGSSLDFSQCEFLTLFAKGCCYEITNLSGTLTLTDYKVNFAPYSFAGSGFTGELYLNDNYTWFNAHIFENCTGFTSIRLPHSTGLTIQDMAFSGCTGITELVIPDNVTFYATGGTPKQFYGCTNLNKVTFGSNFTIDASGLNNYPQFFGNCDINCPLVLRNGTVLKNTGSSLTSLFYNTGFTDLVIDGTVTLSGYLFNGSNIRQILNLSDISITTTSYGLNADSIQNHIDCMVFIGNTEIITSTENTGAVYTFISMLPLIMVLGIVLVSIGLLLYRRA